jgi:hypothetical protein
MGARTRIELTLGPGGLLMPTSSAWLARLLVGTIAAASSAIGCNAIFGIEEIKASDAGDVAPGQETADSREDIAESPDANPGPARPEEIGAGESGEDP